MDTQNPTEKELLDELLGKLLKDYKKPEDILGEQGLLKRLSKAILSGFDQPFLFVFAGNYATPDPKLGYIFLNTKDQAGMGWIQKNPKYGEPGQLMYDRGAPKGVGGFTSQVKDANGHVIGSWPCQKPPWARLIAVNANTGDIPVAGAVGFE